MPNFKKNKSAFMMKGKSPLMKKLVGNQHKLPTDLKKEIINSPVKAYGKVSAIKNYKKGYYGS